jgi:glucose/arabinose dehydrogenase
VSRFTANGDFAVAMSELAILDLDPLSSANNHNGGAIHFGIDGKLYVAVGDNANGANSTVLTNLKGKMLRLNADGMIPTDNPFFNQTTGVNRAIWAIGLRNPFTFSIHSASGRMFINDVGEATWEEIYEGGAGENYGWPSTEGATNEPAFQTPVYSYEHGSVVAPFTFTGVVGMQRAIGTTSPQTIGGTNYQFRSWSDRGSPTHTITTPSSNTTITAQFNKRKNG